jgi:phosphopantothenoylcysteine decarboxylase/phosphopantothenate--cysteine ligase
MRVLITCGPSYEPIDAARRITNFSTGKLGITLANFFTQRGAEVICLKGEQATCPDPLELARVESFSTNADLAEKLTTISRRKPIDVVFHAAALCDFRVERVLNSENEEIRSPKFSSRERELRLVLVPTLKVLPTLRDIFPAAQIVGWKYEPGGTREDAFAKAWQQLRESRTDACVLNGAGYGPGFALFFPDGEVRPAADAISLASQLWHWLSN